MADTRKFVKVFLASPGDLADERKAAKWVVDEFNNQWAKALGYQVDLVGWEDTLPGYGRPQALINRDLEGCELFVGLMWKRWGTPPDNSGRYTSGFEEEFSISIVRREKEGRPEISLFFRDIGEEFLRDPGVELNKVLAFKKQITDEKKTLYGTFADIREFESKFRSCITAHVNRLRSEDLVEGAEKSQAPTTASDSQHAPQIDSSVAETPLSIEGTQFLREFMKKSERDTDQEPLTAPEIARFRLLSTLVGNQSNDDVSLGVHAGPRHVPA